MNINQSYKAYIPHVKIMIIFVYSFKMGISKLKLRIEKVFFSGVTDNQFDLSFIAVFILVDHSRDVACNVPTRFWL